MPEPGSAPQRSERSKSAISGPEFQRAFDAMGVSVGQISRLSGMNEKRLIRMFSGDDPEMPPKTMDVIAFVFYHHPELRTLKGDIPLPIKEWGIDDVVEVEFRG